MPKGLLNAKKTFLEADLHQYSSFPLQLSIQHWDQHERSHAPQTPLAGLWSTINLQVYVFLTWAYWISHYSTQSTFWWNIPRISGTDCTSETPSQSSTNLFPFFLYSKLPQSVSPHRNSCLSPVLISGGTRNTKAHNACKWSRICTWAISRDHT